MGKVMATLASEDVSFGELAELIEKDTVLAGNVLRLVNSALYGRRGTISSVRHAVSLMGLVRLRNSVMSLSVARLWSNVKLPPGLSDSKFNQHAVASAVLADLLAQKQPDVQYPEGAFVAGLLHDLGLMLLGIAYPDEFAAIVDLNEDSQISIPEAERQVVGFSHSDISAEALHRWNLPEPIRQAVRYQFDPPEADERVPLSALLQATEQATNYLGITAIGPPEGSPEDVCRALEKIGIQESAEELIEEFNAEFAPMKSFF